MVGRTDRLRIAKDVAAILRDSGAIDRFRRQGYTRVDPFEIAAFAGRSFSANIVRSHTP